jgi:hypothetical protein
MKEVLVPDIGDSATPVIEVLVKPGDVVKAMIRHHTRERQGDHGGAGALRRGGEGCR